MHYDLYKIQVTFEVKLFMANKRLIIFLGFFAPVCLLAQPQAFDSPTIKKNDSVRTTDSIRRPSDDLDLFEKKIISYQQVIDKLISNNRIFKDYPPSFLSTEKTRTNNSNDELIFYLLLFICAALAFMKVFYNRYFNTLFRVFFNTSLRQSQLTDQLLQSTLTSLLFNLLFMISGGVYLFFLLEHFHFLTREHMGFSMFICMLILIATYAGKHLVLKLIGWITGQSDLIEEYVFIVFLINKMLGILLLPLVILIAFTDKPLHDFFTTLSLILVGLMFSIRFLRAYGSLRRRVKISSMHFLLYILAVEILPLLILYKLALHFLSKNL